MNQSGMDVIVLSNNHHNHIQKESESTSRNEILQINFTTKSQIKKRIGKKILQTQNNTETSHPQGRGSEYNNNSSNNISNNSSTLEHWPLKIFHKNR